MRAPVLPAYQLSPPDEADARSSLERICRGDGGARWAQLRRRVGAEADQPLSLRELEALAESCVDRQGCERVFGISLLVRVQTYLILHEQQLGARPD